MAEIQRKNPSKLRTVTAVTSSSASVDPIAEDSITS
jgi:hypothetical protein